MRYSTVLLAQGRPGSPWTWRHDGRDRLCGPAPGCSGIWAISPAPFGRAPLPQSSAEEPPLRWWMRFSKRSAAAVFFGFSMTGMTP